MTHTADDGGGAIHQLQESPRRDEDLARARSRCGVGMVWRWGEEAQGRGEGVCSAVGAPPEAREGPPQMGPDVLRGCSY